MGASGATPARSRRASRRRRAAAGPTGTRSPRGRRPAAARSRPEQPGVGAARDGVGHPRETVERRTRQPRRRGQAAGAGSSPRDRGRRHRPRSGRRVASISAEIRLEGLEVGGQARRRDPERPPDGQRLLVVASPLVARQRLDPGVVRGDGRVDERRVDPQARGRGRGRCSAAVAVARPGSRTSPRIPRWRSCRRRISPRAALAVPYTMRRYERSVPDRRDHGSARKSEWSATPAATSGCAIWSSSARGPAPSRSIASRLRRHASLPGP